MLINTREANGEMKLALLDEAVKGYGALLTESHDFHEDAGRKEVADVFSEAMALNYSLHRRLSIGSKRYVVAFVGLSNVGKSTLLNALLGSELTPRRNGPCTSAPIEFERGESLCLRIPQTRSFRNPPIIPCNNVEAVHTYLQRLATQAPSGRQQQKITVSVPLPLMHPLLDSGVVIADTPGFGSVSTDQAAEVQETELHDYIAREVVQVFWIVLAEQGITAREAAFYHKHLKATCDDIVVTGAEEWELEERSRFQDRFCEFIFGGRLSRPFHFVSGKLGLAARLHPDLQVQAQGLKNYGITDLEDRLMEVASANSRNSLIDGEFRALVTDLHQWLRGYHNCHGRALKYLYAPGSLQRWPQVEYLGSPIVQDAL
jgi:GTP-binding protein EngB required for normal cell division